MTQTLHKAGNKPIGNVNHLLSDIKERGLNVKQILDIGANRGDWAIMAKGIFPDAEVYMIEPLSEMEESLLKICTDFSGVKYFPFAVGDKIGTHVMTTWGDNLAGANCRLEENEYLLKSNKQRIISIKTIDSMIEKGEIKIPEIAKLDIQGYELEALRGGTHLFGITELFILETSLFQFTAGNPILSDIVIFMTQQGYEIYDFAGFLRRPFDGALAQIDVCFAKKDGILRASNRWV